MARTSNNNAKPAKGRSEPDLVANYSPIGITAVAASARYQGERNNKAHMSETRAPSSSEEDDGAADPSRARGRRK